jgi:enolase
MHVEAVDSRGRMTCHVRVPLESEQVPSSECPCGDEDLAVFEPDGGPGR